MAATGYCVKCKEKVDIKGAKEVTMKNGRAELVRSAEQRYSVSLRDKNK